MYIRHKTKKMNQTEFRKLIQEEIKKVIGENKYNSFKSDLDGIIQFASVSLNGDIITIYLDNEPNKEKNIINTLVRTKYSDSLKKIRSEDDVMKFKLIREEIQKVMNESEKNNIEITTDLYSIEDDIKYDFENLSDELNVGGLMTSKELRQADIDPITLHHPIYGSLKNYIQIYLKKGTMGRFLEPGYFMGGGQETSLEKGWYRKI